MREPEATCKNGLSQMLGIEFEMMEILQVIGYQSIHGHLRTLKIGISWTSSQMLQEVVYQGPELQCP
jgi:hypothetical protein